jgi:ATP-dependent DNA helicase PIF1
MSVIIESIESLQLQTKKTEPTFSVVNDKHNLIETVINDDNGMTNRIINDVFVNKRNIYLSGPGGTGKSYLLVNTIKRIAEKKHINVAMTSTTGVSALSIGGTTIHRWSGIKLGKEPLMVITKRIFNNRESLDRWRQCHIMIVDEVSMFGCQPLELVNRVAQEIRGNKKPFGGIQMIFSGDFLQLPPINDEFAFNSEVWNDLDIRCYRLCTPRRYPDVAHFEMLLRARVGEVTPDDIKKLKKRVDAYIDYIGSGGERKDEIKPTRIFSLKKDVERHNMTQLNNLKTERFIYNATDKITIKKSKDGSVIGDKKKLTAKEISDYTEFMDTAVYRQVFFKKGAQVMLTCNLDIDLGLVNGSRGVVKSCDSEAVEILFKNGINTRIGMYANDFDDGRVKMTRNQIPLILAWAISIHKSQGATLDYAIVDLGSSIFAAGMGYVALSRVRTLDGLLLSNFIPSKLYGNEEALEFEELMEATESADDKTEEVEEKEKEVEEKEKEVEEKEKEVEEKVEVKVEKEVEKVEEEVSSSSDEESSDEEENSEEESSEEE